jgi:hypothetical protein
MNMPGASMSIYGKGPNGISLEIKIAALDKPKVEVYNLTGDSQKIDTMDGGAFVSPIFAGLTK